MTSLRDGYHNGDWRNDAIKALKKYYKDIRFMPNGEPARGPEFDMLAQELASIFLTAHESLRREPLLRLEKIVGDFERKIREFEQTVQDELGR